MFSMLAPSGSERDSIIAGLFLGAHRTHGNVLRQCIALSSCKGPRSLDVPADGDALQRGPFGGGGGGLHADPAHGSDVRSGPEAARENAQSERAHRRRFALAGTPRIGCPE